MSKPLDTPQRYSLDELAALVDLPRRSIRYYVQIGLVDRPTGETRAAYCTNTHEEQLIAVRKWSASVLSLDRIRELVAWRRRAGTGPPTGSGYGGGLESPGHCQRSRVDHRARPGRLVAAPGQGVLPGGGRGV